MEENATLTPETIEWYKGLQGRVKHAVATPSAPPPQIGASAEQYDAKMSLGEHMYRDYRDSYERKGVMDRIEFWASKELDTADITSLLAATIAPRISVQRQTETKFRNICDAQPGPKPIISDWLYRIREERIGNQYAPPFNPDGNIPADDQAIRAQMYNSLMFVGETLRQSIIASNMASVQADVNLMAREMDHCLVRIMKSENRFLLRGVQQSSYAPSAIPQCDGFMTTSNLNVIDIGGVDLSHDWIALGQQLICETKFGYDVQLCMLTNVRQVGTVRALEIDRYTGNNPMTFEMYNKELAAKFSEYRIPVDRIYEPNTGPPIPVIRETDLPPNTAILFILHFPMEAEFTLGGQVGPHTLARYTERLVNLAVCFKGFSGDFPLRESRVVYSNVAA